MRFIKTLLTIAIIIVSLSKINAQFTSKNSEDIYYNILDNLNKECNKSIPNLLIKTTKLLINTPYKTATLEGETETLKVNLQETDCIIFTETCLAIALNAHKNNYLPDSLFSTIKQLRYRNGIVNGYLSRLHYTSEWITQAQKNNFLVDISKELGNNTKVTSKISFMSSNPDKYEYFRKNSNAVQIIKRIEDTLNTKEYYYIPKDMVPNIINDLKNGDIVCFNTNIKGLDISHVGIIYKTKKIITFIHASSKANKVIIEPKGLIKYINDIKSNNGIRILRAKNYF